MKIRFELIRHGSTISNETHRYLGQVQEGLSKKGIEEIKALKERNLLKKPDVLFCSPMSRCLESASILFGEITPNIVEEFKEINFGDFEGKNYEELKANMNYQKWLDSYCESKIPNGESKEEFRKRVICGFENNMQAVIKKIEKTKDPVVAFVVHGGTIMALMSEWTKKDYYDFQVRNATGYLCTVEWEKDDMRIIDYQKIEYGVK